MIIPTQIDLLRYVEEINFQSRVWSLYSSNYSNGDKSWNVLLSVIDNINNKNSENNNDNTGNDDNNMNIQNNHENDDDIDNNDNIPKDKKFSHSNKLYILQIIDYMLQPSLGILDKKVVEQSRKFENAFLASKGFVNVLQVCKSMHIYVYIQIYMYIYMYILYIV